MTAKHLINSVAEGRFPRRFSDRSIHVTLKNGQTLKDAAGNDAVFKTLRAAREAARMHGGRVSGWNYSSGRMVEE